YLSSTQCAISYNKMKVVGLVSGGKDSCYNMIECVRSGHQIVALAHLYPPSGAEMDSFMYQTVGSEAVALYAKATGLPLYTRPIVGESRDTGSADHYASSRNSGDSEDEVEDLYKLLAEVKAGIPGLQAVSVGAILSNYQRVRVESVCERLDLQVLAFLWRRDQTELLEEMLFSDLDAILIKVAAYGLSPKRHLGRRLADIRDELVRLAAPAAGGLSPCGEGGEYETLALDCPLFKHGRIVLDNGHLTAAGTDSRVVVHSDDAFAPVCYLKLTGCCRLGEPNAGLEEFSAKQLSPIDRISPAVIEREFQIDAKNYPNSRGGSLYCDDDSNDLPSLRLSVINVQVAEQSGEISATEMAKLLMSKANAAIQAAGGEQSAEMRPLLCVLTVPDMSSFALVNSVYGSPELGFASRPGYRSPPARACVELATAASEVMSASILVLEEDKGSDASTVAAMHVRSRSHWAPANIGPYSQCIALANHRLLLISGQIAMDPATLEIPLGSSAQWQADLSLRHTLRVARANGYQGRFGSGSKDCSLFICFGLDADCLSAGVDSFQRLICRENPSRLVLPALCTGLPKGAKVEWLTFLVNANDDTLTTSIEYVDELDDVTTLISRWQRGAKNSLAVCLVNETALAGRSYDLSSNIAGCPVLQIRCHGFLSQRYGNSAAVVARLNF
ncbi:hypothetical protein BOX15_Mlig031941g3, partial [Macrostomum lignano]